MHISKGNSLFLGQLLVGECSTDEQMSCQSNVVGSCFGQSTVSARTVGVLSYAINLEHELACCLPHL